MGVVCRKDFGSPGVPVSTSCRYVTVVYVKKRRTMLTTLMRGVTPLCIRIKPIARTGGARLAQAQDFRFLKGRERETVLDCLLPFTAKG